MSLHRIAVCSVLTVCCEFPLSRSDCGMIPTSSAQPVRRIAIALETSRVSLLNIQTGTCQSPHAVCIHLSYLACSAISTTCDAYGGSTCHGRSGPSVCVTKKTHQLLRVLRVFVPHKLTALKKKHAPQGGETTTMFRSLSARVPVFRS